MAGTAKYLKMDRHFVLLDGSSGAITQVRSPALLVNLVNGEILGHGEEETLDLLQEALVRQWKEKGWLQNADQLVKLSGLNSEQLNRALVDFQYRLTLIAPHVRSSVQLVVAHHQVTVVPGEKPRVFIHPKSDALTELRIRNYLKSEGLLEPLEAPPSSGGAAAGG